MSLRRDVLSRSATAANLSMTKRNNPPPRPSAAEATRRATAEGPSPRFPFEPRPFQRRPWFLAAAAAALAAWLIFLLLMAWEPWGREEKQKPPPRDKEWSLKPVRLRGRIANRTGRWR
jgi:hypothetical protein